MILDGLLENQIFLKTLIPFLRQKEDLYLVGGAVRDYILGIKSHDLDFVMGGDVIKTARGAARTLGGKFFILDDVRSTARVILPDDPRLSLDFALMRGDSLLDDLTARDFTINAIAVNIQNPEILVDPLRGVQDLHDRVLRNCSERTYVDDPVRILRAIRLAFQFNLRFDKDSLDLLKVSIPELSGVSTERKRDELFRMLEGNFSHSAIRTLELLGVLIEVMPELMGLKEIPYSDNYFQNRWDYALSTLRNLDSLENIYLQKRASDYSGNLVLAMINSELVAYRNKLNEYFSKSLADQRKLISLLKIAGLYSIFALDMGGINHPNHGFLSLYPDQKKLAGFFLTRFALGQDESIRLATILMNQGTLDRFSGLIKAEDRRGIYQYFKLAGNAGLDLAFIRLAQTLSQSGNDLPNKLWLHWLSVMHVLCHAWFEKYDEWIRPIRILTGFDVQRQLGISPGPVLGQALGALEESQAAGEVCTLDGAEAFITSWYKTQSK